MTILSSPPLRATWACLEQSLRKRRPVQITYHGRQRLICPHALGWNNHRPVLLAYQADGLTSPGSDDARTRWRCMFVDEIDHITPSDPTTPWRTADNYKPSRPFNTSTAQVSIAVGRDQTPEEAGSLGFPHSDFGPTSA